MKNIMFLGDSLTAGTIGSSWFELLQGEALFKEFNLINAGENGFTMAGLHMKLKEHLKTNPPPHVLVIEGGANDILLPHMQGADHSWNPFIRKLLRHGSAPASSARAFRKISSELLSNAVDSGISQIFMCTIPCLGEDLESDLNHRRGEYNRIIREVCSELSQNGYSCTCLETALEVEAILGKTGSRWLFRTPDDLQNDALYIAENGEDALCRERKLQLTIDGAHLNRRGAELFSSLVIKYFKENSNLL